MRRERPRASYEDALAHPSDAPSPEELASVGDDVRRLRSAIAQLTPLQQEVIVLRYLEGRSTKETAVVTGKRESTVRGIQMRALAALRELLGDISL
jgi:RNA polymerase sigma-70 factor (ECF subfamily)